ncbi:DNA mismatch repair protein MutL [Halogranum gelatinilyticum]|uniref:DNA mismatch repair protein MutL n=1 Tax=Halogranum gelatinilyticum TaxID=660521 RepID=A0A1G9XWH6_9EURY|nr:DNA mismatch repair endonuclease MutL [Halogranum gelatinilyticum]SDN01110.1 DNA mismatch repair protein MutL [Halogranum gelatinilyticum]
MTETVRKLEPETVERIAAGEVVTRPASVVKELIENSLDAGAESIRVEVDGDGTAMLKVADDGHGMSEADATLAVDHHTTSKLGESSDLERVSTLGFRGEALPSIAAVATLDVTTNDGGPRGTRVLVEGGETTTSPAGRATGTTVEVRDLFHNRPARRKSLSSTQAEFGRVSDVVSRYALLHPDVRFRLRHDGREVFSTPGSGSYTDAVLGVYDRTVAGQSTTFAHETAVSVDGDDHSLTVDGLLVYPSVTRSRRDHVHVAVNGRTVGNAGLKRAVVSGYGTLLPQGREPIAVVSVSLSPQLVDANVHPSKDEVAFLDGDAVESAVEEAVHEAVTTADLRQSGEVAMDLETTLERVDGDSLFDEVTVIGQFRELYLLCEADDDLLVVDQHAAHERINYERLQRALADSPVEAALVDPAETVSLSPSEAAVADHNRELLAKLGFDFSSFGGGTYRLTGLPAPLGRVADASAFHDALDALRAGDDPADARDELLKDLACHPSLKAGDTLDAETAEELLGRLGECEQPFACPHGRPTVLSIEEETLASGFGRS